MIVSIIRNVYSGLDELIDFFPEDLLNDILDKISKEDEIIDIKQITIHE